MIPIRIQGHRGWRGRYPENTWLAFEKACELNIAAVELDVVAGPEKHLVVSHDPWHLDEDGRANALMSYSNEDFNELRVGAKEDPDFPNQELHALPYLKLGDLLSRWNRSLPTLNIEVKSKAIWEDRFQPIYHELGDLLLKELQGYKGSVQLQSFDWRLVQQLSLVSGLPVNWICESPREWKDFKTGFRRIGQFLHGLSLYESLVDDEIVDWCGRNELDLAVWTCNDLERFDQLIQTGVTNFITDYPEKLLNHLERKGIPSSATFFST